MKAGPQQKIILYYKFVPVPDPQMTMHWQKELCTRLNLKGRIIISDHGINGTLGGNLDDLRAYKRAMKISKLFDDITYKWSDGNRDDFPKLSVKVRDELVTLAPGKPFDVFDSGTALKPAQWAKHLKQNPDAVIIDARNSYESDIGRFNNAITPNIKAFRDIKPELEKLPKDKPVYTYCTGDIRCEYLSAYMKSEGFEDVYHLDGGIVKYGQQFGEDGLWEGSCYVFDDRKHIDFSDEPNIISSCVHCSTPSSDQIDCSDTTCGRQVVVCLNCQQSQPFCAGHRTVMA